MSTNNATTPIANAMKGTLFYKFLTTTPKDSVPKANEITPKKEVETESKNNNLQLDFVAEKSNTSEDKPASPVVGKKRGRTPSSNAKKAGGTKKGKGKGNDKTTEEEVEVVLSPENPSKENEEVVVLENCEISQDSESLKVTNSCDVVLNADIVVDNTGVTCLDIPPASSVASTCEKEIACAIEAETVLSANEEMKIDLVEEVPSSSFSLAVVSSDMDNTVVTEIVKSGRGCREKKSKRVVQLDAIALENIEACKVEIMTLFTEFQSLERLPEFCDVNLEMTTTKESIWNLLLSSDVVESEVVSSSQSSDGDVISSSSEAVDAMSSADNMSSSSSSSSSLSSSFIDRWGRSIFKLLIAWTQGSAVVVSGIEGYRNLHQKILEFLEECHERVTNEDSNDVAMSHWKEVEKWMITNAWAMREKVSNDNDSTEQEFRDVVDRLMEQIDYGHIDMKNQDVLGEMMTDVSIIRWESRGTMWFSSNSQALLREVRQLRRRFGKLISGWAKKMEVFACNGDDKKIQDWNMKIEKMKQEMDKWKDKRREMMLKKQAEMEEKARKEEAKLAKLKEKELLAAKKAQEMEEKKKAKQAGNNNNHSSSSSSSNSNNNHHSSHNNSNNSGNNAASANGGLDSKKATLLSPLLEKQQNVLKSFFKSSVNVTSSVGSGNGHSTSNNGNNNSMISSCSTVSGCHNNNNNNTNSGGGCGGGGSNAMLSGFNNSRSESMLMEEQTQETMNRIDAALQQKSWSWDSLMKSLRKSSSQRSRIRRPMKKLTVTVTSDRYCGFERETYSELKEVSIYPKIKTLFFHEDERPAYVGTFSKIHCGLKARNPWYRNFEVFNYDYDSEAEWEEEEEGEDIAESMGEESEEDNEDEDVGRNARTGHKPNDLVYDDFFLQDNDFGSDADSDGEQMVGSLCRSQRYEGLQVSGLRFLPGHCSESTLRCSPSSVATTQLSTSSAATCLSAPITTPIVSNSTTVNMSNNTCGMSVESMGGSLPSLPSYNVCVEVWKNVGKGYQMTAQRVAEGDVEGKEKDKAAVEDSTKTVLRVACDEGGDHACHRLASLSTIRWLPLAGGSTVSTHQIMLGKSPSTWFQESANQGVSTHGDASGEKLADLKGFDETSTKMFVEYIHGKKDAAEKIINDFHDYWSNLENKTSSHRILPKTHIKRKLADISTKERHPEGYGSSRWIVNNEILAATQACVDPIVYSPKKVKTSKSSSSSSLKKKISSPANDSENGNGGSSPSRISPRILKTPLKLFAEQTSSDPSCHASATSTANVATKDIEQEEQHDDNNNEDAEEEEEEEKGIADERQQHEQQQNDNDIDDSGNDERDHDEEDEDSDNGSIYGQKQNICKKKNGSSPKSMHTEK